jgi:phosphoglycerol transferase MdoB-like AlkP superfamily enzyme
MRVFNSRFGHLYVFGLVFLAVNLLLRLALCLRAWHSMDLAPLHLAGMLLVGFLFDLVTFFYMALPVALFLILVPDLLFRSRVHRYAATAVYFVAVYVLLFDVAAEWLFWDEFESRFNFVAVDYLIYTHELIGNIRESYPLPVILGGLAAGALVIYLLTRRLLGQAFEVATTFRQRLKVGLVFVVAPALSFLLVDQGLSSISRNHYNNEIAKDGLYSFCYALRESAMDYEAFYLTEDDRAAFGHLRDEVKTDATRFVSDDPLSITRQVVRPGPEKKYNLLIVVVESLSAKYLGVFGGEGGLTPNLDALAGQSLFFTHCYATGTRTDRGLEAVTLSLPPTPGRSMVKRPGGEHLFSLGAIVRRRGYDTKFIYSGYSTFDNMNAFYEANGFETVDGADFADDEITFRNVWGVCDQDLYRRTVKECDRSFAAGRPFCVIVLTTSNHRPFTFPASAPAPAAKGRLRGVWYSDYAIGELLASARSRPWFASTLFVILADHCAASAGKTEVPVEEYRIPLFIYGPRLVRPARVETLASQIDVAPTLLGLLNFSYTSKFFGRDVLEPGSGRALVGNYEKVGLYRGGKLTLLLPKKKVQTFTVRPDGRQDETQVDSALLLDTMSYYQPAAYLLRNHLYTAD